MHSIKRHGLANLKHKLVKGDKEGHFILIEGAIHQKKITTVNLYASNVGTSNLIKHTLLDLKTHIDPNTVILKDFNTLLLQIDRKSTQNINKPKNWMTPYM
jgi:hypothetical protein